LKDPEQMANFLRLYEIKSNYNHIRFVLFVINVGLVVDILQDLCFIVKEMGNLLTMSSGNLALASMILEALGSFLDLVPISHVVASVNLEFVISLLV
jgi:hypothetical protein